LSVTFSNHFISPFCRCYVGQICLQCFDTVAWVSGRASSL